MLNIRKKYTRLYQSIETLPIWNYHKVQTTGDLKHLVIRGRPKHNVLLKLWERLQEEFTEKVGLSDVGNAIIQKSKKLMIAELDRIIAEVEGGHNLSKAKVTIKQLTRELSERPESSIQSLDEQAAILESWFKIGIDIHTVSVLRFYKYLELYQKQIEQYERD